MLCISTQSTASGARAFASDGIGMPCPLLRALMITNQHDSEHQASSVMQSGYSTSHSLGLDAV
jgi:hypothetical protein